MPKPNMEKPLSPDKAVFPRESVSENRHALRHNQYEVDVYKLVHLAREMPDTTISINSYIADLNDQCWTDDNEKTISPQEVISALTDAGSVEKAIAAHPEFSSHLRKIEKTDPNYPVIIFESKIIDGMHRFVKAVFEGRTDLRAKVIAEIPNAAIIKIHNR